MGKQVRFTVNGDPYGKGRPRFTRTGQTYNSRKDKNYEHLVRTEYEIQSGEKLEGAIYAKITAYFGVNKSDSAKIREAKLLNNIPVTKKPDCDNIAKTILDALNGAAYHDDSQVTYLEVYKLYSDYPHVDVTLIALEQ